MRNEFFDCSREKEQIETIISHYWSENLEKKNSFSILLSVCYLHMKMANKKIIFKTRK